MGIGPFSEVPLVPFAYVRVNPDGTVYQDSNSGLTVQKTAPSTYAIDIPDNLAVSSKELYPVVTIFGNFLVPVIVQASSDDQVTRLLIIPSLPSTGQPVDAAFAVILFKTVLPPA